MCLAQDTGLYLCCQFHAQFRSLLARFKFHFSFCGCPFFSSSSGMVTTTQGMFSLLPIGRHLCSFAHIRIRATLLRIAASAKLSHVILRFVDQPPRPALTRCRRLITPRFRCLSPRYSWSLVRHNHKLRPPPHHNEGAAPVEFAQQPYAAGIVGKRRSNSCQWHKRLQP